MFCRPSILLAYPLGARSVSNDDICHEVRFSAWAEARVSSPSYNTVEIPATVLAATFIVRHGEAAIERNVVLSDEIEYAWFPLANSIIFIRSDKFLEVDDAFVSKMKILNLERQKLCRRYSRNGGDDRAESGIVAGGR